MMTRAVLFTLAAFLSCGASAQPALSYGIGAQTCGEYADFRRNVSDQSYEAAVRIWADGFASGHNQFGRTRFEGRVDQAGLVLFLDKYCHDAPSSSVGEGVYEYMKVSSGAPPVTRW